MKYTLYSIAEATLDYIADKLYALSYAVSELAMKVFDAKIEMKYKNKQNH